jgi:hypothetical protein
MLLCTGPHYSLDSLHDSPDKNPNVKGIHERFARLGVIATILRNKEGRQRCVDRFNSSFVYDTRRFRYDFFYKNGVPKWRGTGYYYSRFRPGLGVSFEFPFCARHPISRSTVRTRILDGSFIGLAIHHSKDELHT